MKKKIIYIIIILVTLLQSIFIVIYSPRIKNNEIIEVNSIENEKKVKYIEEIETELKVIKNLNIESYARIDDNWKINCSINGKKEELLLSLDNLNNYKIQNYNLVYNKENIVLYLEIISK